MNEEKFWLLVSLCLSGEATDDEVRSVEEFLENHPELLEAHSSLKRLWNTPAVYTAPDPDESFSRHLTNLHQAARNDDDSPNIAAHPRRIRRIVASLAVAATLTAAFLLLLPMFSKKASTKNPASIVSTKPGSRSYIELPDGTDVWLNADSKLQYDASFGSGTRTVTLTGEAYFDVAKDKDHPFVIHTSALDIKVLGTAFNVRSYPGEKNTETSLFKGSVAIITHANPERTIILKPSEKLVVRNEGASGSGSSPQAKNRGMGSSPLLTLANIQIKPGNSSPTETLWMHNKLSFDSEPLETVALKIERWFDVKVVIRDQSLKAKLYTAVFDEDDLTEVMEALRIAGNFKYRIKDKTITIDQ